MVTVETAEDGRSSTPRHGRRARAVPARVPTRVSSWRDRPSSRVRRRRSQRRRVQELRADEVHPRLRQLRVHPAGAAQLECVHCRGLRDPRHSSRARRRLRSCSAATAPRASPHRGRGGDAPGQEDRSGARGAEPVLGDRARRPCLRADRKRRAGGGTPRRPQDGSGCDTVRERLDSSVPGCPCLQELAASVGRQPATSRRVRCRRGSTRRFPMADYGRLR